MKRFIFLIGCFLTVFATAASAGKVYLKNGKVVTGKVISETKYSVKVMVKGFPNTFYWDQIEKVEKEDQDSEQKTKIFEGPVSEEKKELILRLMEANGALKGIRATIRTGVGYLPPERREKFEKYLQADELVARFVKVYAKYFTEDDLRGLIRFYTSPLGQKNLRVVPKIMQDSMEEAIAYFKEIEEKPNE